MTGDEKRIIGAARAGDREACADLVRANYRAIYSFLAYLSGSTSLADDLTQETFTTAWEGLRRFRGDASFRTWLHRIAYGKFVDASRRARREAAAIDAATASNQPSAATGPGVAVAHEQAQVVREALTCLGEAERSAIVMHYFQGMSLSETALTLGEPVGTVKWRTNQALKKLKARLNGKV